ncbi:hypothetical protein EDC56_0098 [Sinobacterium caligoides]|uniref:Uncharacterized protein n=1 Tax=Sinobacterium caligoides TaxID=933926 RepID=A0A3N2DY44_9GAMM|nr:hypothetical protein EDC56_0098 [Sinobacterium caligoides]
MHRFYALQGTETAVADQHKIKHVKYLITLEENTLSTKDK